LGFGPGYLQAQLSKDGYEAFGIDESIQMVARARSLLLRYIQVRGRNGYAQSPSLSRARAQSLPFPDACFNSVVSTFPSEYIFNPDTLNEITRVLHPGGCLVIVLAAQNTGPGLAEKFSSFLVRATGQSLDWYPAVKEVLNHSGLNPEILHLDVHSSRILMVLARK
jgi:ubiquinone/menaquinone biosynthesis C-methylase UbiE